MSMNTVLSFGVSNETNKCILEDAIVYVLEAVMPVCLEIFSRGREMEAITAYVIVGCAVYTHTHRRWHSVNIHE